MTDLSAIVTLNKRAPGTSRGSTKKGQMKKYSAACGLCKRTFEHEKELVVKQMLGYHMKTAHGIQGVSKDPEARRRHSREAYWKKMGYSEEVIAKKRALYEAKVASSHTPTPTQSEANRKQPRREAVPLALSECPCCGARFFVTKKDSNEEAS